MPFPHSSPQQFSTCIFHAPPGERGKKKPTNQTKPKPSMVKQRETELENFCVCTNPKHTAQEQGKSIELPEGERQAEPQEPARVLIPDRQSMRISIYAQVPNSTAALPLPPTQTALREAHKAPSFFLHPLPREGKNVVPIYQLLLLFLFVFGLICPLGATYKPEEQSKDGTRFLSLCVSMSACLVLLGIEKASKVSKYPRYHQAKTFKESK